MNEGKKRNYMPEKLEFMSVGLSVEDAALLREIARERKMTEGGVIGRWVGAYRRAQEMAQEEVAARVAETPAIVEWRGAEL